MISPKDGSHVENKYNMELRDHINLVEASTRPAKLETTPLPYSEKDQIGRAHV